MLPRSLMNADLRLFNFPPQVILLKDDPEQKIEEVTFEENEVYIVDVAMSSGEGKPREGDTRTTVFKRNVDRNYNLKIKASRVIFSEINKKFPTMPFTIRALEDERQAKLGVRECMQHQLLTGYPVLYERPGDFVAHVKFTILLLPNGNTKITGLDLPAGLYVSSEDKVLPEATRELLAAATKTKKSKKKKAAAQESES
jgi:methionine aminopeptidase